MPINADAYMSRNLPNVEYSINSEGIPFGDFDSPTLALLEQDYEIAVQRGYFADWTNFTREVMVSPIVQRILSLNQDNYALIAPMTSAFSLALGESSNTINVLMSLQWREILIQSTLSGFVRTKEETTAWNQRIHKYQLPLNLLVEDEIVT